MSLTGECRHPRPKRTGHLAGYGLFCDWHEWRRAGVRNERVMSDPPLITPLLGSGALKGAIVGFSIVVRPLVYARHLGFQIPMILAGLQWRGLLMADRQCVPQSIEWLD